MEITDIRMKLTFNESKMKAVASITLGNDFVVHDIKIIDNMGKLFVAMPSRVTPTGEFKDIAHPINSKARNAIEEELIKRYSLLLYESGVTEEKIDENPDINNIN